MRTALIPLLVNLLLLGAIRRVAAQDNSTTSTDPPTSAPTEDPPTPTLTDPPTPEPTDAPVSEPTDPPTSAPTDPPTSAPVAAPVTPDPTVSPTDPPTPKPTVYNTPSPTPWGGITYHAGEPPVRWTVKLPGTGGNDDPAPRRGNAVTVSPDDMFVYVTMDDGELSILDAVDGSTRGTLMPIAVRGGNVECSSGVSFGFNEDVGMFAVYGIVETGGTGGTASRVVAVEHPTGRNLWTSLEMDGAISGTPMVGSDGRYVYLTRNTDDDTNGHFTLLRINDDGDTAEVFFTEESGQYDVNETGAFAPLNLALKPKSGNYKGGRWNTNDVAAWAHRWGGGASVAGYTRVFQLPNEDWDGQASSLRTKVIEDVAWSTYSKPTFGPEGEDIYYTVTKAEMRGWYDTRWGRGPWKGELPQDPASGRAPIPNSAALSNSGARLFVPSAAASFHSVWSHNGTVIWSYVTENEVVTEPRVSPDDARVYSIQYSDGTVTAHNTENGARIWSVNCKKYQSTNPFCQYHVEAEFSLSSTGYYMYYSNTRGTVVALELGYATPPTAKPTSKPTVAPTPEPTGIPTLAPVPTYEPSAMPTPEEPWTRPPTSNPTDSPTSPPSPVPTTLEPTGTPTGTPTVMPSTLAPTMEDQTMEPTLMPVVDTVDPTFEPTASPTPEPSDPPVLQDTFSGGERMGGSLACLSSIGAFLAAYLMCLML